MIMIINIAGEYTKTPGARYIADGEFSGEDFRNTILEPRYKECKENNKKLTINFDGGYGYGTSFLEESFGGLVRKGYSSEELLKNIELISEEEPELIDKVVKYIKEAVYEKKN